MSRAFETLNFFARLESCTPAKVLQNFLEAREVIYTLSDGDRQISYHTHGISID